MNTTEKYNLADIAIAHALKCGAQQVSVSISESRNNNIEVRDKQIDNLTESNRSSLSISLYVDKRFSSHSTNRLKKDDLMKFIEEAVAATKYLAEDEFRILPDESLYYKGGGEDLKMLDSSMENITAETRIALAQSVMDEAYKKDERIISVNSNYSDSISSRVMVTSNGFRGDSSRTSASLSASVSIKTDQGRPSDYWWETSLFFDKLKKTDIGTKALERTIKKIGPRKINSGKYQMLLENRVSGNLLSPVLSALFGESIYQKQSFFAGSKDKKVASELMTVIDDPAIPSSPGSRHFDNEGLALKKRPIVENGILKDFYIDTYYGKKLGLAPTSGTSTNLIFKLGTRNCSEIAGSLKKGILVTGFNGGNCNGSTGDFSYGIEGFYVENGAIVHPVNEMNISGNMTQIWNNLIEAGNDIIEGSSSQIPSLLLDNIDFSGI